MKKILLLIMIFFIGCSQNKQPVKTQSNYQFYSSSTSVYKPTVSQQQPSQIIYPSASQDLIVDVQEQQFQTIVVQPQQQEVYTIPQKQENEFYISNIEIESNQRAIRSNNIGFKISIKQNQAGHWYNVSWECNGDTSMYSDIYLIDSKTEKVVGVGSFIPRGAKRGGFNIPMNLVSDVKNLKVIIR